MTYNVHGCIGSGGRDTTREVAEVVASCEPDVVALQELEAPTWKLDQDDASYDGPHHARDIARPLGMQVLFCRTFARGAGHYGHALLTRKPVRLVKSGTLPLSSSPRSEPRGALWAVVSLGDVDVQVLSTHLGVRRFERAAQSRVLLGGDWIGHPDFRPPGVVCGDFNALPVASTYRRFAARLLDAHLAAPRIRPRPTFPARFPLLRLDHVFVTTRVHVRRAWVPRSHTSRHASDHLPLIVDLELDA
jgi:endonuclease/exonuclease/phosphatase family metal-dependent hydrolase